MSDLAGFILEKYGLDCVPGRKCICPKCGHKTFSMKRDGTVAKCFHPSCLWFVTPGDIDPKPSLHKLLSMLLREWRQELLTGDNRYQQGGMRYLLEERGISKVVIESASVGLVPQEFDVKVPLDEMLEELRSSPKRGPGRPPKGEFDPSSYAEWLEEQGNDLQKKASFFKGWLAFFYTEGRGRLCAIHFRKPFTKDIKTFKPKRMGLFGRDIFVPLKSRAHSDLNQIGLVTEGEFDCLRVQSVLVEANRDPALVVATAGTSLVDIQALREAISRPVIIRDNDDAGEKLVERISQEMNCEVCSLPVGFKDIDEYLGSLKSSPEKAFKALCSIVQARKPRFRPTDSVKRYVNQIRSGIIKDSSRGDGQMKKHEIDQKVAGTIIEEMNARGAFFRDGDLAYYLSRQTNEVMTVEPGNRALAALLSEFGLNATDKLCKFVVEELYQHGIRHGEHKTVHRFSHLEYSPDEQSVQYIAAENNTILRITMDSVEYVSNGSDGMLFLSSGEHIPADIPLGATGGGNLFDELIVKPASFKQERLRKQDTGFLLKCWVLGSVMREIIPRKPILALIGPTGSGKTTLLRMIGKTLSGDCWDVTAVPRKEEDFDPLVTNRALIGLDNVDGKIEWLNDKLAVAATGGTIPKRVLYITNREIEYPIRVWLAVTSRAPYFRREDVADRLLILKTESIHAREDVDFRADLDMIGDVLSHRRELWAELVSLCQSILGVIDSEDIRSIVVEGARMQDFARFTWIVGRALGCESMVQGIWEKLKIVQREFALEGDPFIPAHRIWVGEHSGSEVSALDLSKELKQVAQRRGWEWPYLGGRAIGQKIKNLEDEIREYCETRLREGPTKQKLYTFILQESGDSETDSGPIPEPIPDARSRM